MKITDAEWREFQSIPDQGYSHRGYLDRVYSAKMEPVAAVIREVLTEADLPYCPLGGGKTCLTLRPEGGHRCWRCRVEEALKGATSS